MKNYIFYLLTLCFVLMSCQETSTDDIVPENENHGTFDDFLNFWSQREGNTIHIRARKTDNSQYVYKATAKLETIYNPALVINESQVLDFEQTYQNSDFTLYDLRSDELSNVFSNNLTFTYSDSGNILMNTTSSSSDNSIYISDAIDANIYGLVDNKVVPGTQIEWNIDTNSNEEVILGVEYRPELQFDQSVKDADPEYHYDFISVEDNGNYVITQQDLDNYIDGAVLTFYIGRANYIITDTSEGDVIDISALSLESKDMVIAK